MGSGGGGGKVRRPSFAAVGIERSDIACILEIAEVKGTWLVCAPPGRRARGFCSYAENGEQWHDRSLLQPRSHRNGRVGSYAHEKLKHKGEDVVRGAWVK